MLFPVKFFKARVAKLADAPDLGSGGAILRGSSPLPGTPHLTCAWRNHRCGETAGPGCRDDFDKTKNVKANRACFFFWSATTVVALALATALAASNEPLNSTPQQVFDGMRESFRAEAAKGVHARYQWELSGPTGGQWWLEVHEGTFRMSRGRIDSPSVTFIATDKDWVALSNGTLNGTWAFLTGRLKIRGDKGLAKKLGQIFP